VTLNTTYDLAGRILSEQNPAAASEPGLYLSRDLEPARQHRWGRRADPQLHLRFLLSNGYMQIGAVS